MSAESTRTTLIHCMRKLLRENRISRIKVSDICESAHISRRTFYRYYSDKYELMNDAAFNYLYQNTEIRETDSQWDVIEKCCKLMYRERTFFLHAFESKGQNGFWEEAVTFMIPFARKEYPDSGYLIDTCNDLMISGIYTMMRLIEKWIKDGFPTDPETFCRRSRHAIAIYSKWLYQSAMGIEREPASERQLMDRSW